MTDPTVIRIEDLTEVYDDYLVGISRDQGAARIERTVPRRYQHAAADHPQVAEWIRALVRRAVDSRTDARIHLKDGPSMLLLGPTGTGKTHQAYGALRALAASGVRLGWEISTAADIYARLRPRPDVDSETEHDRLASAGLLVIDDLGAAKGSEWTEEINYRLINYRYEQELPTLITSNVPVAQLREQLGERVASRLREMTTRVVLEGPDRRGVAA